MDSRLGGAHLTSDARGALVGPPAPREDCLTHPRRSSPPLVLVDLAQNGTAQKLMRAVVLKRPAAMGPSGLPLTDTAGGPLARSYVRSGSYNTRCPWEPYYVRSDKLANVSRAPRGGQMDVSTA